MLHIHSIYNQLWQLKTKFMNILCNEGGFVNEGDIAMREIGGCLQLCIDNFSL